MLHFDRQRRLPRHRLIVHRAGVVAMVGLAWTSAVATANDDAVIDWQQSRFTEVVRADGESAIPPADEPPTQPAAPPLDAPPSPSVDQPLSPRSDAPLPKPAITESELDAESTDPFSRPPGEYLRSLSDIRVSLDTPTGETLAAKEFSERGLMTLAPHAWPATTPAAANYHFVSGPLWYEDANLERCGVSHCCVLQPVVSGTHFLATTALLPYHFAAAPPCETKPVKKFCPPGCRYGFCDNYLPDPDLGGGTAQALAITGLIFLIP